MYSLLFVCVPDMGHLHPLLAVAQQVARNSKHNVSVASMDYVRSKVEAQGLEFVSIGSYTAEEAAEHERQTRSVFEAHAAFKDKITAAAKAQVEIAGYKMATGLFARLEQAGRKGTMPHILVTDSWTLAGYEAAEKFHLPLAVLAQYPLNQSLIMAGLNQHNLHSHVPAETMLANTSAKAGPLVRYVVAPLLKRVYAVLVNIILDGPRSRVRAKLGLPPLAAGSGGNLSVQPGVARSVFICGASWELNTRRPLPDNWHLVGPMGVDYSALGSFPPALGAKDAAVEQFLTDAQAAGEAVVYVATGTMVVLTVQQIAAMVQAFKTLSATNPVRILWSLKENTQQLLPEELRSINTVGKSDSGGKAEADVASSGSSNSRRVLVLPWVNQAAVLAHPAVKVFISHGGLGSTNEGLSAGKPIVCMPFSGDQPTIAQQLVDHGVGAKVAPAGLKASALVAAVRKVLLHGSYAEAAAAMGKRLRAESGPSKAAELLAEFAAAGRACQHHCTVARERLSSNRL